MQNTWIERKCITARAPSMALSATTYIMPTLENSKIVSQIVRIQMATDDVSVVCGFVCVVWMLLMSWF